MDPAPVDPAPGPSGGEPAVPVAGAARVIRVRVFVDGRVQGVGFRASAAREAVRLGVRGWARNLPDGRVEAVFEGPRHAVEDMLAWTRHGPAGARVTDMGIHDEQPQGERGFSVE
jgi:acylphosphatase